MKNFSYLSTEEVVALHEICIDEFGGLRGLRDFGLLESAVHQPRQSFGGEDLYKTVWEKAAALAWSLSQNQSFLDGNKRTAALSMLVFLDINGHECRATPGCLYEAIMNISEKKYTYQDLACWIETNSQKIWCV